ncbi:hypothetical protein ED733_001800 [Metarhizium rileyi]|uniref:Uncharacterized protein n=1 Tax=Metarhizium rileyi (strain RCEF 4871) TaxID=1649241 RepID=A0A5C6G1Y9_METRR|nr:hypothetical protein ED733_001800 [Metarhizium rileyi]
MRKALLTSSEVSALVSIVVVVEAKLQYNVIILTNLVLLFTLALFLSGYALQQRTLQDLRVAIRPGHIRPSPKAHLPNYFKRETVELQDGTVVVKESLADQDEKARIAQKYELRQEKKPKTRSRSRSKSGTKAEPETKKTGEVGPEPEPQPQVKIEAQNSEAKKQATEEQLLMLEVIEKHAAQQAWGVDHPDPLAKNPLPITRAERRKLIKDEIQRLAQADKPVYYQRRLW